MTACVILGIVSFYLAVHTLTAWTCLFAAIGLLLWITTALVLSIQLAINNHRSVSPADPFYEPRSFLTQGIVGFGALGLNELDDGWLTGSKGILLIVLGVLFGALSFGFAFGTITGWTWLFGPLTLLLWTGAGYVFVHGFWDRYSL